ncbi:MAG: transposase [Chitinophagaceae bacterium]|nr:transposase [Chitinophagaceae bacterium]
MKKSNKKCLCCGSNCIQKWGNRNGSQRFRCKDCGYCFTLKNHSVKLRNQFVWFKKWIIEWQVYKYLIRDSGMSQTTIQKLLKTYLKAAPTIAIKSKTNVHLLIDASYFSNGLCLLLYYDHDIRYVQLYRTTNREKYKEIKGDLENLMKLNVAVYSVTCDGHKTILKAVRKIFPNAVIQRCLVHIKRQVKNYLSEHPKLLQAKELLSISSRPSKSRFFNF